MNPSEIARETLKRLALQRTPPTPDNYRTLYHEIAGTVATESFPDKSLKQLAASLPRDTAEQARFVRQFDGAIVEHNWSGLQGLLKNWSQAAAIESTLDVGVAPTETAISAVPLAPTFGRVDTPAASLPSGKSNGELLELLPQLLENAISILLADNEELAGQAAHLAAAARSAGDSKEIAAFVTAMKRFSYRLNFVAEDQSELRGGVLHLLGLVIDNNNELVIDDQWLQGQIATVLDLVSEPLNLRRLDDVERRMKDVIFKQSGLKKSLIDDRDQIKQMLATFVDRLADFSESTSDYHDKIEHCAKRISQANDIGELTEVLDEVIRETRTIQINAQRSRDELISMRDKANAAEREVERLQEELASASQMVCHDPLTGVPNRKGMDEALDAEVARARRQKGHLCIALLDIDNFKKFNDSFAHAARDAALVNMAKVVQETIRPEDTLARYGGEEFVVILPDTPLENVVTAMTRAQRELTRHFFLYENEKILITFSCGVAELDAEETAKDALQRSDGAMYLAKRASKNRVMAA